MPGEALQNHRKTLSSYPMPKPMHHKNPQDKPLLNCPGQEQNPLQKKQMTSSSQSLHPFPSRTKESNPSTHMSTHPHPLRPHSAPPRQGDHHMVFIPVRLGKQVCGPAWSPKPTPPSLLVTVTQQPTKGWGGRSPVNSTSKRRGTMPKFASRSDVSVTIDFTARAPLMAISTVRPWILRSLEGHGTHQSKARPRRGCFGVEAYSALRVDGTNPMMSLSFWFRVKVWRVAEFLVCFLELVL